MAFKTELPVAAALIKHLPLAVCSGLLVILGADGDLLSWHMLYVLPIAVLQVALVASLGCFLSASIVFVRDVGIALPNLLTIVLFMTPIFYPIESLPRLMRLFSHGNPSYFFVEGYRTLSSTIKQRIACA